MRDRTKDVLQAIGLILVIPIVMGIAPIAVLESRFLAIVAMIAVAIVFYWLGHGHGWDRGYEKGSNQGFIDGYYTSKRGESIPSFIDLKQVSFPPHEKMFPPESRRRGKRKESD